MKESASSKDDYDKGRATRSKSKARRETERKVEFDEGKDNLENFYIQNDNVDSSFEEKNAKDVFYEKVGTTFMKIKENECFDSVTSYVVELPLKEHKRPEVVDAKQTEIENLEFYKTFEEVDDVGQESITMRWVINSK